MLPKLSAILFIFALSSCAQLVNGKSCKEICVSVRKCTNGLCDEPLYPEYSKCEIKCDSEEITETIRNIATNRHSLSDDEEEQINSDDNFSKINDMRDLRNDFRDNVREDLVNSERDVDTKSRDSKSDDSDVIAVLIANDDDRDIRQEARNPVYKSYSIPSATIHPYNRLQHQTSVTHLYPDHFRRFFEYFKRRMFSDNKTLRKKNAEIIGLKNHPLDVIHSERLRRVKRTVGKFLLNRLNGFRSGTGLSAGVVRAKGGSVGGSISGGLGLKAGPEGISADISGRASGQASGYATGEAGIAKNAGLGVEQPGVFPGFGAGVDRSTGIGGGLGGTVGGSLGGSLGVGLGPDVTGVKANVDGGVSGQLSGYGGHQNNRRGGFGSGISGGEIVGGN